MRISAGIISPADRWTISPTTTSSNKISCFPVSALSTQVVVRIICASFAAALPLLVSCTKRRIPDMRTIVVIIITVKGFLSSGAAKMMSVKVETIARINRMAVKGFTNASKTLFKIESLLPFVTILEPYSSLDFLTSCEDSTVFSISRDSQICARA